MAKECINNGAHLEQLRHGGENSRPGLGRAMQICPSGGNPRARPVREHQDELDFALVADCAEDLE